MKEERKEEIQVDENDQKKKTIDFENIKKFKQKMLSYFSQEFFERKLEITTR